MPHLTRALFLLCVLCACSLGAALSSLSGKYKRRAVGKQAFCAPTVDVLEVASNRSEARSFEIAFAGGCGLEGDFTLQPLEKVLVWKTGAVPDAKVMAWSGVDSCTGAAAAIAIFYCQSVERKFLLGGITREKGKCYLDIGQRPDKSYTPCVYEKQRPAWITWVVVAVSILCVLAAFFAVYWFCIREDSCGRNRINGTPNLTTI